MIKKCCKCGKEIKNDEDGFKSLALSDYVCYDCAEEFVSLFRMCVKEGILKFVARELDTDDD